MQSAYECHGDFKITTEHNILMIDVWGPWNQEFFTQFHQQLYIAVHQLPMDIYAVLVSMHGQALPVRDAIDNHIEFISQGNALATAIDLSGCTTAGLSKDLFGKIYTQSNLNHAFFDDKESARTWLFEQLESANGA